MRPDKGAPNLSICLIVFAAWFLLPKKVLKATLLGLGQITACVPAAIVYHPVRLFWKEG
ncbi:hypothetical protein M1146_05780 [Patescibacteria group bacterium]|nr:hypothetical protein [Patescibacteria group bacterium]